MCENLILVVSEGDSEENYISVFNRFLREHTDKSNCKIVNKDLHGLNTNNFLLKIEKILKPVSGNFCAAYIWLDIDIFKRKYSSLSEEKIKHKIQSEINTIKLNKKIKELNLILCFNYMNGEDFLSMNYGDVILNAWIKFCKTNHHMKTPMTATVYKPKAMEIIPCKKDKALFNDLCQDQYIKTLIKNNKKTTVPFHSDFIDIIELIYKKVV